MKRKSWFYLVDETQFGLEQYQGLFGLFNSSLRSSWLKFDLLDEREIHKMIISFSESLVEKRKLQITVGRNPYEEFIFTVDELEQLIKDLIIIKRIGELQKEINDMRYIKSKEFEPWDLRRYEDIVEEITQYKILLENRKGYEPFNYNLAMVKKEYCNFIRRARREMERKRDEKEKN